MEPLSYEAVDGDGLVLRPPRPEDVDDLVAACADPLIAELVPSLPVRGGAAEVRDWIAAALAAADRRELVIADPGTGRLLGGCRLYHLSALDRSGELGYWVAPWARGPRLAGRATDALTGWAFGHGLGRLEILARPDDPASQRVALAAGYRWEGRRRAAEYGRDGRRYDLVAFARLATDPPGPAPRAVPDLPGGRLTDGVTELRPLGPADTADAAALHAEPDVAATTVGDATREVARMCAEAEGEWLAGRRCRLTIRDAASGAFAGDIGLFNFDPQLGEAMTGYAMMAAWRGRGHATRAVRLLAGWAFTHAGLARIIAGTVPENVASQRVLERAGFQREGRQRSRLPGPAGTRVDDVLYALLPEDLSPTRTPPR
jgi:RimJ/RimL family protein N-acetyltransferase